MARRRIALSPDSEVTVAYEQGVIDTLDWLDGTAVVAPATGLPRAAAEQGAVSAEWLASRDLEHADRADPVASQRPGAVARTVSWYRRMPGHDFV